MKLPLVRKEEVAEGTSAFWFDTSKENLSFKPGQFGNFVLQEMTEDDSKGNRRSFSFASSPNNTEELMIATRMRDSAFKNTLNAMDKGDEIDMRGPMGNFTLHEDTSKPAVFLAGGIGITPFLSMIKWSTEDDTGHELHLFYSNRTPKSVAFLSELEDLASKNDKFNLIPTITDTDDPGWSYEQGMLGSEMYEKNLPERVIEEAIWYIVGPPGMVQGVKESLMEWRIDELRIKSEDFSGY